MPRGRILLKGDRVWVRPTHVVNPHDFYVRRLDDDEWITTFQELVVYDLSSLACVPGSLPLYGSLVLLQHEKHGWLRGQVVQVCEDDKCSVFTMDYGETVHGVESSTLRQLLVGGARPPMAIHCRLHHCEPREHVWSPANISIFLSYLGTEPMTMTVMRASPTDQLEVELVNDLHETVNKMMVIAEAACFVTGRQQVNRLLPSIPNGPTPTSLLTFTYDSLAIGIETEARVLHTEGSIFHLIKKERKLAYESVSAFVSAEFHRCELLLREKTLSGTPVVCKIMRGKQKRCFRGVVLDVSRDKNGSNQANVYLVDMGCRLAVTIEEGTLRRPNRRLFKEATFAITCNLTYRQKMDSEIRATLRPGNFVTVVAEKVGGDHTTPHIVSVVNNSLLKH